MMTAKELKENAKIITTGQYTGYNFDDDFLNKFCKQLCKEQRENCHNESYRIMRTSFAHTDVLEGVLNAPEPEL